MKKEISTWIASAHLVKGFLNKLGETLQQCVDPAHMFTRPSKCASRNLRRQIRFISSSSQHSLQRYSGPIPTSQKAPSISSDTPDETPVRYTTEEEAAAEDDTPKSNVPIRVGRPKIGETAPLGIETLGRPGSVFVLGEKRLRQSNNGGTTVNNIATKKWNDRLVLDQLDEEENELSDSSYATINLERIRSTRQAHDVLLKNEWATLRTAIENGFTVLQLSNYVRQFGKEPIETNDSVWRPGMSLYLNSEGEQPIDESKIPGADTRKIFAEEILRSCWKLEIKGETGQLHLPLKSQDILMLLNSKHGPLGEFAETHGVKIDVSRSLNLVSLTGDRYSCESVLEPIQDFVSRIRSTTMSIISPYASSSIFPKGDSRFDEEFLAWMGDQYGVACDKREMSKKGINIAYLPDNKRDAEEARRNLGFGLILKRDPEGTRKNLGFGLILQKRAPSELCMHATSSEKADVNPVNTPDSLSWLDKRKEWFRWTKSTKGVNSLSSSEVPNETTGPCPDSLRSFVCNNRLHRYKPSKADRLSTKTTATVGKALFLKPPKLEARSISADELRKTTSRSQRIFINEISGAHSFLSRLEPVSEDISQTSHKIRLIPSPFNTHEAPPIELELDIPVSDSASKPNIRTANAILNEKNMDLLLPQNTLDLRFTKTICHDLSPESVPTAQHENDATMASILKSVQDLGYRLPLTEPQPPAPPFCHLMIPKKLLFGVNKKNSPRQDTVSGDELVEVEYMFPPLRSLLGSRLEVFNYKGLNLGFSQSFTGPMLADQTTNLSVAMEVVPGVRPKNCSSASFDQFYGHACNLAFELDGMK